MTTSLPNRYPAPLGLTPQPCVSNEETCKKATLVKKVKIIIEGMAVWKETLRAMSSSGFLLSNVTLVKLRLLVQLLAYFG